MAPLVRRTWSLRGQTPILYQKTSSWQKASIIAALSVSPKRQKVGLYFSIHKKVNIDSSRVVRFLKSIRQQIHGHVIIVWDRSRIHRADRVKILTKEKYRWDVFHFPPYAPELNPAEMYWNYLKTKPLANQPAYSVDRLAYSARYHGSVIQKRQGLLKSFLYATPLFFSHQ